MLNYLPLWPHKLNSQVVEGLPIEVEVLKMHYRKRLETYQSSRACLREIRRMVRHWQLTLVEREDLGLKN